MANKTKKSWQVPTLINLDGSQVESGVAPIQEGSHSALSATGSLPGILIS